MYSLAVCTYLIMQSMLYVCCMYALCQRELLIVTLHRHAHAHGFSINLLPGNRRQRSIRALHRTYVVLIWPLERDARRGKAIDDPDQPG
jgi:hypothetical protein